MTPSLTEFVVLAGIYLIPASLVFALKLRFKGAFVIAVSLAAASLLFVARSEGRPLLPNGVPELVGQFFGITTVGVVLGWLFYLPAFTWRKVSSARSGRRNAVNCATCASQLATSSETQQKHSDAGEPQVTTDVQFAKRLSYVRRHWRGELSLATSYWINFFLLSVAFFLLGVWLTESPLVQNPVITARVTIVFFAVALLLIYPWQVVGLWRACSRRVTGRRKTFWAHTARVLIVFGCIGTLGQIRSSWPMYEAMCRMGFMPDKYSDYTVALTEEDSCIDISGPLGFGVSRDVAKLLKKHPSVHTLILNSPGGRVYEGREIAKLIRNHELDTYSVEGCGSACTIAFLAGKKRYVGTGAHLGFHRYRNEYEDLGFHMDLEKEQQSDYLAFREWGVKQEFLAKVFEAPNDQLFTPPIDELISAGVIHGTMVRNQLSSTPSLPSQDSRFATLTLPLGVSVEAPKNWWILDGDFNSTIETAAEAAINLSGVELPTGRTVTLFRANSMPKTTYAAIAIEATDSEISPDELKNASEEEVKELSPMLNEMMQKILSIQDLKVIEFYGVRREFVGRHPSLVIEYKRSGPRGPVIVQMTRLFVGKKEISLNLSYRESEMQLWKPIIQYIRKSLTVK